LFLATVLAAGTITAPKAVAAGEQFAFPADTVPSPVPANGEELYLEVTLNQTGSGRLAPFLLRDGKLLAGVEALRQLGFGLPGRNPEEIVALEDLPGLVVRYDAALQRVSLEAPLSLLSLETTVLNVPSGANAKASASPGALLNYDLYGSHQGNASNLTATAELRIFGIGSGIFSNTAVTRTYRIDDGSGRDDGWRGETVRLDSNWQLSFPESATSLTVGDTFSGFLNWTRAVRLGGLQIGRNFSLQPYRITTPLPAFLGEVAVPSAVDLYVNGVRQYSGEVPAGPFQLATVPGITGMGNAQIVVTDAFGRIRTLDFPFYATQQLLAKGLSDWSLSAGVVRENYGLRSFSYASDPVASGNLRYGVSDRFTVETHAEGGGGLINGGAGGLWILGRAGVLSASHARSTLDDLRGSQTAVGYNWNSGRFNFSIDSQRTHGEYRDIASLYGPLPASISERGLAGVTLPQFGNLSLSYIRLQYPETEMSRYVGAYWSQSFASGWSANLSFNQNPDRRSDRSLYLSVAVALDSDRQLNTSLQRNGDRSNGVVDISRPVPGDGERGGYGWRLQARGGDDGAGGLAEVGWFNNAGRYGAGVASYGSESYGYASASGSLVWMGGHPFVARNIGDAFAVVSTDGIAGVPVKLENRLIGHTDARGMLLVTPLQSWQRNKLSIDPMDLPANMRIDQVELLATPRQRSGTRVRFGIAPVRAATVVLHDASGAPLPLGSTIAVNGTTEAASSIGYDGEVYLDALDTRNLLRVRTPDGACVASFDYPLVSNDIPRIGPLICNQESPP
jgi:outer membrane usher protein